MKTSHWAAAGSSQKSIAFPICHVVSIQTRLNSAFTCQTTHTPSMNENVHGFFDKRASTHWRRRERWRRHIEWWLVPHKNPLISRFVTSFLSKQVSIVRLHIKQHTQQVWMKTYMAFIYKSASTHRRRRENWRRHIERRRVPHKNPLLSRFVTSFQQDSIAFKPKCMETSETWEKWRRHIEW